MQTGGQAFRENVLFTHRGLSGPAILQASNYWQQGEPISIDWLPDEDVEVLLEHAHQKHPKQQLKTLLAACCRRDCSGTAAERYSNPLAQLGKAQMEP